MVKNQRNDLAIFCPFLNRQEFFKNLGLSFKTSDSDFRDLLDEFFHMVEKFFQKIKIAGLISKSLKPNSGWSTGFKNHVTRKRFVYWKRLLDNFLNPVLNNSFYTYNQFSFQNALLTWSFPVVQKIVSRRGLHLELMRKNHSSEQILMRKKLKSTFLEVKIFRLKFFSVWNFGFIFER